MLTQGQVRQMQERATGMLAQAGIVLTARQTCAQHRHPPLSETNPGKQETFRCRWGRVWLYVEGEPSQTIQARVPEGSETYYTVFHEIELHPGDQYTIPPNTWHWFKQETKELSSLNFRVLAMTSLTSSLILVSIVLPKLLNRR